MRHPSTMVSSRRSKEVFDEVEKIQYLLAKDFARHEDRRELFKKQFLRESRKHHQCICDAACAASNSMSAAAASALLFAQHDASPQHDPHNRRDPPKEKGDDDDDTEDTPRAKVQREQEHIWNGLKNLYTPPDAATGILCDLCFAFRSASLVHTLPAPWQEYACENSSSKHYYYHPDTKEVLWSPPAGTKALSMLVFERTNSVFSVCRCKPSHDRRRRLMQRFQEHAQQTALAEAEKRNRQLRGAFSSLTLTLIKNEPE